MFFRRYDGQTADESIIETSQVAIIELEPPASAAGVRKGYPLFIAEPTNDRGEAPKSYLVDSLGDLIQRFGRPSQYIGSAADGYQGNLHVQAEKCRPAFPCILVTVDTEAGSVTFTRPNPGTATLVSVNAAPFDLEPADTLKFTVDAAPQVATWDAAAALLTGAAATYAACVNGHFLDVKVDGGTVQRITTDGSHNSQALWHDRLNFVLVGAKAVDSAGQTRLISDKRGTDSEIEVMGTSSADVLAALGLGAAAATGTGDVADIDAVTAQEVVDVINADTAGCTATVSGGAVVITHDTTGAGHTLQITGGAANAAFAFPVAIASGGTGTAPAGTIFAGLRVYDSVGARTWLTLEDVAFAAGDLTKTVRVRAASGTTGTSLAGNVTTITDTVFDATLTVSNALNVVAADLDTAYTAACNIAADAGDQYARRAQFFASCRHSEAVMADLTAAAVARSSVGRGALAIVAPPVGTSQATAEGSAGVGVAATGSGGRSERRLYTWPSYRGRTSVTGTVATVELTADMLLAAVLGQCDPEESPDRNDATSAACMSNVVGLQALSTPLTYNAYVSLKASGICALRIDPDQGAFFQDGVTSSLTSGRTQIARRTMVDFIGDSIGVRMLPFKGQPFRSSVREDALASLEGFHANLLRQDRIFGYTCQDITTGPDRANGILRMAIKVDLLGNIGSGAITLMAAPGILEITETA